MMGKPSSSQLSTKSNSSINSSNSKINMNGTLRTPKHIQNNKKMRKRTKDKINKLLNNLQTRHSETVLSGNSEILLASTMLPKDRMFNVQSENIYPTHNVVNYITIDDNDDKITNALKTPMKNKYLTCSTPLTTNQSPHECKSNNSSIILQNKNDFVNLTTNDESYVTIDLTGETDKIFKMNNTVIDLVNVTESPDCTVVSVNDCSAAIDSDVTVIQGDEWSVDRQVQKLSRNIKKLNEHAKGTLLNLIVEQVFSGCIGPPIIRKSLTSLTKSLSREIFEDKYIKEVILGETPSKNSVGSNIYHPTTSKKTQSGLRMIVIDGSNVAMEHTKGKEFSVRGLKICIDYFLRRGHVVKAFVPRFRCKYGKSTNPRLLDEMERKGLVTYTPSREIAGRTVTSYDDRYIIQCAAEFGGVIVTGDNYRDLINENPKWKDVIINRLLPFTWVDDMIMFPKDPLGRNGPSLEQFLRHTPTSSHQ